MEEKDYKLETYLKRLHRLLLHIGGASLDGSSHHRQEFVYIDFAVV